MNSLGTNGIITNCTWLILPTQRKGGNLEQSVWLLPDEEILLEIAACSEWLTSHNSRGVGSTSRLLPVMTTVCNLMNEALKKEPPTSCSYVNDKPFILR